MTVPMTAVVVVIPMVMAGRRDARRPEVEARDRIRRDGQGEDRGQRLGGRVVQREARGRGAACLGGGRAEVEQRDPPDERPVDRRAGGQDAQIGRASCRERV